MNVLLTGFAGFIGSQILRDLLAKGYTVVGIDNMSEGSSTSNYSEFTDYGSFYPLFCNMEYENTLGQIEDLGIPIDYIINCGAQSHVDRSFGQVNTFIDSNIKGPLNLAQFALKHKVKKFVQVSTDEVYADSEQPFHEGSLLSPQNAYATSKASAEMFLQNYHRAFGLPLVITNGANTYGFRQLEEKIIPLTIKRIVNGQKVPLYKTRAQRLWMHVSDHSSGIISAMENGEIGQKYCLAPNFTDELYTDDLVRKICDLLGKKFEDCVEYVPDRVNYDLRYSMCNEKAFRDLAWSAKKHIEDELKVVVAYYFGKFSK